MPVASIYMGIADTKQDEDVLYAANVTTAFDTSNFAGAAVYSAKLEDGSALPLWLTLNAATGVITGLPEHDDARQIHNIVVTVTDAGNSSITLSDSYYLYIENINDAPEIVKESLYSEVSKSGSGEVSGWIWVNDDEIDDGYNWGTIRDDQPVVTDQVVTTLASGNVKTMLSNPFGDQIIEERASDWSSHTTTYTLASGLTWTEDWYKNEAGAYVNTITSNMGHNATSVDTLTDYVGYSTSVEVNTGTNYVLGELVTMDNLVFEYKQTSAAGSELTAISGSIIFNNVSHTTFLSSGPREFGFKAESSHGIYSLAYDGLLYTLSNQQGTYGTIAFNEQGEWVYSLDKTDVDTIALGLANNPLAGNVALESFSLDISDGKDVTTETIRIEVTGGLNTITETVSNTTHGDASANTLQGDAIVKVIYADAGDDDISGGAADNALHGGMGNDHIKGEGGDDQLFTGTGVDLASGGAGSDEIYLTADGVWGGGYVAYNAAVAADDIGTGEMIVLSGYNRYEDVVDGGGAEYDCLILSDTDDAFFLEDAFSQLHSQISTVITADNYQSAARIANIDAILAGAGNDIIDLTTISFASHSTDMTVYGEAGNDHLWGGVGDDHLRGGDGDDRLVGGSGYDRLHGGNDADQFAFTATSGANKIDDFNTDEGDSIMFYYQQSSVSGVDASVVDAWLYDNLSVSSQQNGTIVWDTQHGSNVVEIDLSLSFDSGDLDQQFFLDNIVFEAIV